MDFRKLNSVTVREPYYIPGFEEIVEKVGVGRVLSKIDLAKGFHQVEVEERDRAKTAFICPFGKFQYRRMPFGLTNAPAVFQRLMDDVIVSCMDFACIYIDDVLVVSESWSVHMCHLRAVFEVLKEAGLTCKRSKCVFGKRKLEFLGHLFGDVVCVPEARVKAIVEHPFPRTQRQLRGFLGLVGFYRRFVSGFHWWSAVLTPHTSGSGTGKVSWTSPVEEAFHELCKCLCNYVVLCVPRPEDMFVLECDASGSGVGAVLSVRRGEELLLVAFFSRQLRGAQLRYSAQELECLAVVELITHFAYYLYGRRFDVVTDHRGLESLRDGRQWYRRVQGWALRLAEFDFVISYRRGSDNVVADDLSRCFEDENEKLIDGVMSDGVRTSDKEKTGGCVADTHLLKEGEMWACPKACPHELYELVCIFMREYVISIFYSAYFLIW